MRKLMIMLYSLGIVTAAPLHVAAQTPTYFPMFPGSAVRQELLEEITLSEAQMKELETLSNALHQRMRALQPTMSEASDEARRQKLRELMTAHAKEIRAILSQNQQAIFDENYARWQQRREGISAEGRGSPSSLASARRSLSEIMRESSTSGVGGRANELS